MGKRFLPASDARQASTPGSSSEYGEVSALAIIMPGMMMIAVTYGLARFSYGLFLPQFREVFHLGSGWLGLIGSGSYLGYCLAIILASVLSPRWGPRAVLSLAGIMAITGMGLVASAMNALMLGVGILIAGMSTGIASPPMGDAVRIRLSAARQTPANTWINAGTSLGITISGPIALMAGSHWRMAWIGFVVLAIVNLAWNARMMPTGTQQGRAPARLQVRRSITSLFNAHSLPLTSAAFIMGFASAVYWNFSRDLLMSSGHLSSGLSGVFWTIIGIAGLAGGLAGGFVQRYGLQLASSMALVGFAITIAMLPLAPEQLVVVYLSAIAFGGLYILLTGILLVWSVAVFQQQPSFGIGVAFLMIAVGQVVGSPIAGWIASIMNLSTAFWIFAAVSLSGGLIRPHPRERNHFAGT